jgi:hypothetical protein
MKDRDELARLQRHLRHEIAGLDMLRIRDPRTQGRRVFGSVPAAMVVRLPICVRSGPS